MCWAGQLGFPPRRYCHNCLPCQLEPAGSCAGWQHDHYGASGDAQPALPVWPCRHAAQRRSGGLVASSSGSFRPVVVFVVVVAEVARVTGGNSS